MAHNLDPKLCVFAVDLVVGMTSLSRHEAAVLRIPAVSAYSMLSVLSEDALTRRRLGNGISPFHWDEVVGRRCARALEKEHILRWEDLAPGRR